MSDTKIVFLEQRDVTNLKPVTKQYFMQNTGIKKTMLYAMIERGEIVTDKSRKIPFSEMLRFMREPVVKKRKVA